MIDLDSIMKCSVQLAEEPASVLIKILASQMAAKFTGVTSAQGKRFNVSAFSYFRFKLCLRRSTDEFRGQYVW